MRKIDDIFKDLIELLQEGRASTSVKDAIAFPGLSIMMISPEIIEERRQSNTGRRLKELLSELLMSSKATAQCKEYLVEDAFCGYLHGKMTGAILLPFVSDEGGFDPFCGSIDLYEKDLLRQAYRTYRSMVHPDILAEVLPRFEEWLRAWLETYGSDIDVEQMLGWVESRLKAAA